MNETVGSHTTLRLEASRDWVARVTQSEAAGLQGISAWEAVPPGSWLRMLLCLCLKHSDSYGAHMRPSYMMDLWVWEDAPDAHQICMCGLDTAAR